MAEKSAPAMPPPLMPLATSATTAATIRKRCAHVSAASPPRENPGPQPAPHPLRAASQPLDRFREVFKRHPIEILWQIVVREVRQRQCRHAVRGQERRNELVESAAIRSAEHDDARRVGHTCRREQRAPNPALAHGGLHDVRGQQPTLECRAHLFIAVDTHGRGVRDRLQPRQGFDHAQRHPTPRRSVPTRTGRRARSPHNRRRSPDARQHPRRLGRWRRIRRLLPPSANRCGVEHARVNPGLTSDTSIVTG